MFSQECLLFQCRPGFSPTRSKVKRGSGGSTLGYPLVTNNIGENCIARGVGLYPKEHSAVVLVCAVWLYSSILCLLFSREHQESMTSCVLILGKVFRFCASLVPLHLSPLLIRSIHVHTRGKWTFLQRLFLYFRRDPVSAADVARHSGSSRGWHGIGVHQFFLPIPLWPFLRRRIRRRNRPPP